MQLEVMNCHQNKRRNLPLVEKMRRFVKVDRKSIVDKIVIFPSKFKEGLLSYPF